MNVCSKRDSAKGVVNDVITVEDSSVDLVEVVSKTKSSIISGGDKKS